MSSEHGHFLDAAAGLVALGVIGKLLPPIAALMTIIWYSIQFVRLLKNRHNNK